MLLFSSWIFVSVVAGIGSNLFNFLNRYLLKGDKDTTGFAWFFEIFRLLCFLFLAFFDYKLIITPKSTIIFLLLGVTELIGVYWYMKMHAYSQLSISSILTRTRLIWIPICAFFLLGETLKMTEYLGIFILFAGLSIVVSPKKIFVDKGAMYANLSAFMIAINIVLTKMAFPYASVSIINVMICLPSVVLFPLFMKNFTIRIQKVFTQKLWLKILTLSVNVVASFIFTYALKIGDASKVTAIYQGMMIIAVLAGILFLDERDNIVRKIIGSVIVLFGVLLLTTI